MTQVGEIHLAGSGDVTMRLGAARGAPKAQRLKPPKVRTVPPQNNILSSHSP